jgi:hypothetical protein
MIKSIIVNKEYKTNIINIITKYKDIEFINKLLYFKQSRRLKILNLNFNK